MTEHLDLPSLTEFAARYHLARHVRTDELAPDDQKILDAIKSDANSLSAAQDGLDRSFEYLRKMIDRRVDRFRDKMSKDLADGLAEFLETLDRHHCGFCGEKGGTRLIRCEHQKKTFDNVEIGGLCIDQLKSLFKDLRAWIQDLWNGSRGRVGDETVDVVFATTPRGFNFQQALLREYSVGGYARALPGTDKHRTKVGLHIRERSFGWKQYNLLPYVMIHELLCHAFQSLDTSEQRENADENDAWSEGWMDCLAYELALEWLERQNRLPTEKNKPYGRTQAEYKFAHAETTALHNARYKTEFAAAPDDRFPFRPKQGRDTFETVRSSYSAIYHPISKHPVTKFSVRLNGIATGVNDRIAMVQAFADLLKHDQVDKLHTSIRAFNREPDDKQAMDALQRALR